MTVGSTDTTFIFLLQMAQVNESGGAVANGSSDTDMARSHTAPLGLHPQGMDQAKPNRLGQHLISLVEALGLHDVEGELARRQRAFRQSLFAQRHRRMNSRCTST
jgi:hypothetical protein